jgi:nitrite reductase/ring-hydroxylating ferredoxin subunit
VNGDGRTITGSSTLSERRRAGRWRAEFPYHWDADEQVNRRELLQLAVLTSGALFAGTAVLALLGRARSRRRGEPRMVAPAGELREGEALYFHYPGEDDQAVALRLPGGEVVAYSQKCTHLSCSVYYQAEHDRLYCPCHEGVFDPRTGAPVAGPPQRPLPRIALREENGMLVAVEERP